MCAPYVHHDTYTLSHGKPTGVSVAVLISCSLFTLGFCQLPVNLKKNGYPVLTEIFVSATTCKVRLENHLHRFN